MFGRALIAVHRDVRVCDLPSHACQPEEGPLRPVAEAAIFRGKQGVRQAECEEIIVKLISQRLLSICWLVIVWTNITCK
jgi:hypothetical protein